ncbi:phosphomannomutase [Amaricoccus solimangrovi]|uniref:Phosphomannomutase n=1 Tax=Amaricoccus solimangrovi TaxID=2589815 RepID=A0A501WZ83_9RHOB|nr:phosphomannomutase [Amaricoccus solimangrovi]TPE53017.1 phosphomannomutase [Amaricoccus solimangrovi]
MKFGTSGLRGLVSDMTDEVCARYVAAFVEHLRAAGQAPEAVLIGRDLRPSSPRIAKACAAAVAARGVAAIDCGALPTPALALASAGRGLPAIMVTGSHIPFDRNGLKFYRADGEITKADEEGMIARLDTGSPAATPGEITSDDGAAERLYLRRGIGFFPAGTLAGKRIGVYQHSAVGRDIVLESLRALGADVIPLGRTETFVPIDTEAVRPEDEAAARDWCAEHGLDAVVSTDGDGDRPLIGDETGAFLRGDVVGVLAARYLGADAVATPVSSNSVLERSGWFPRIRRTRIGSPYVIEAMQALAEEGADLVAGYEANGGFLLGGAVTGATGATLAPLVTRDAMLPILAILAMAADLGRPLSALAADLPPRFTASDRLTEFAPERSQALLAALCADDAARAGLLSVLGASVTGIDLTDGPRMSLEGDEIAHLRASGNAPELRCYAEAATPERARAMVAALLARAAEMAPAA